MDQRESQIEAVVDALVHAAGEGDPSARAQAYHVADWAARISGAVAGAPNARFVRRCALLATLAPDVLECIPEVAECGGVVRDVQALAMTHPSQRLRASTASLIIVVADELDSLVYRGDRSLRMTPGAALEFMQRYADDRTRPVVEAALRCLP